MPPTRIFACAVIGREHAILLVQRADGRWTLPAAVVEPGEWVEQALARSVRTLLTVAVSSADLLCLIEDPDELFLVFDVVSDADEDLLAEGQPPQLAWTTPDQLTSLNLWPVALRDVLQHPAPPVWWPHHLS